MPADAEIPLSDAIRALRRELVEAVKEGKDQEVKFALGPIELELQVEVASTGGAGAGIKFLSVPYLGIVPRSVAAAACDVLPERQSWRRQRAMSPYMSKVVEKPSPAPPSAGMERPVLARRRVWNGRCSRAG